MNEKIETIYECEEAINSILSEFLELIEKTEPEHITIAYSLLPTIRNDLTVTICPRVFDKPIKYEDLKNTVWSITARRFIAYLIENDLPIIKYIRPFINEIIASGLDITIALTYADTKPEVVIELIRCRADLEEIPQSIVNYIIKYASEHAKTKREFSAFILFAYFYIVENLTLPDDLIENIGYYLQKLSTIYQHEVLAKLHVRTYLKLINQALLTVVTRTTAYALLTNQEQVLNVIYNLTIIDKKHIQFLNALYDHGIISDDELSENITYLEQIRAVIRDLSTFSYLTKFVKYELEREMDRILSEWTSKLKERILKRRSKYVITISLLYSILHDTITFTKTALETLLLYHHKVIRYTTITKVTKKGFLHLYPFKKLYPYTLPYEVINRLFTLLPEIQPMKQSQVT